MKEFVEFLLKKTYRPKTLVCPDRLIREAFERTVADVQYHFKVSAEQVAHRIQTNQNELGIFLYRLGAAAYSRPSKNTTLLLEAVHWLMRECCACEIYYSTKIGAGFYIIHGVGTVIGSRNTIGKGFQIYQGCTIGHRLEKEEGCVIGDDVTMYPNSHVLGRIRVGDRCVIGSSCQVMKDLPPDTKCRGPVWSGGRKGSANA